MRIIPFPGHGGASPDEAWHAGLEAALSGDGEGPAADAWRELREDVRALAPPMAPDFERQLRERIAERGARRRAPKGWLHLPARPAAAAIIAGMGAVVVAVVIAGPWWGGASQEAVRGRAAEPAVSSSPRAGTPKGASSTAQSAAAGSIAPESGGAASAPGRVQQLAATVSLAAAPTEVQAIADRVARLAVSDGGFVQSSHVQVQQGSTSEANLTLRLPSARLSAALASLGQLAPERGESQSLQDITDAYDAARRRLADATAERQALLRALSAASSEGQIDSLRERLSQARSAVAQARSALQAVSQRASTAEVEVTVIGDAHVGSEGPTLHRGLHDAGRVLTVTLIVLLIAAAVLVPLALLLAALATGRSAWRRYQRERTLDAR